MAAKNLIGSGRLCMIGLVFLVAVAGPARASGMFVGTNLGLGHYAPESGDGLTVISIPDQGSFFGTFQPGFRIGGFADEAGRHQLYVDTGLSLLSSGGTSFTSVQVRGGYDYLFSAAATAPFIGLGVGVMHLSFDNDGATTTVFGGEFGVRHTLAHGHGAVRGAFRVERQLEADTPDAFLPALTVFGLELGLDLYMN